jgi:hypothetical protein
LRGSTGGLILSLRILSGGLSGRSLLRALLQLQLQCPELGERGVRVGRLALGLRLSASAVLALLALLIRAAAALAVAIVPTAGAAAVVLAGPIPVAIPGLALLLARCTGIVRLLLSVRRLPGLASGPLMAVAMAAVAAFAMAVPDLAVGPIALVGARRSVASVRGGRAIGGARRGRSGAVGPLAPAWACIAMPILLVCAAAMLA